MLSRSGLLLHSTHITDIGSMACSAYPSIHPSRIGGEEHGMGWGDQFDLQPTFPCRDPDARGVDNMLCYLA
jgi:hypothetical protein